MLDPGSSDTGPFEAEPAAPPDPSRKPLGLTRLDRCQLATLGPRDLRRIPGFAVDCMAIANNTVTVATERPTFLEPRSRP